MIIDKISNASIYKDIPKEVLNYKLDLNNFKAGKFEIDGDQLFGIGLEYQTDVAEKGLWEAHRKYIDLHYIIEGEENIYISDIKNMDEVNDYQDDYQLFEGEPDQKVFLQAGDIIMLYPHEVHKTSIKSSQVSNVKKIVYKIVIS